MNCDECVHSFHPLPVFWRYKVRVSIPHVRNGCFTANVAIPSLTGDGRLPTLPSTPPPLPAVLRWVGPFGLPALALPRRLRGVTPSRLPRSRASPSPALTRPSASGHTI